MNKARIIQYSFAILIGAIFLISCDNKGGDVAEIKLIPVKNGEEFQYIDRDGKTAINPQFKSATTFRNGLALVQTIGDEPKWGFISEEGNFTIPPNYNYATVFSENLAYVVADNTAPMAINSKGEIAFTLQNAELARIFMGGLSAFSIYDSTSGDGQSTFKWGFVDKQGKISINPQFTNTRFFSDGKCAVQNSDYEWGYIDKEGKIVINYQFDRAGSFNNGRAVVMSGGKVGLIDEYGKYLINPQFQYMIYDGNNYLIRQGGKWGWCDKDGKITINPQFAEAKRFMGHTKAAVKSGENWGYVDRDGKYLINPQFEDAFPYNGSQALVRNGRKYGFIDLDGRYSINPQYDFVGADLIEELEGGGGSLTDDIIYSEVETDFFDIGLIIDRMNPQKPEGLIAGSKLSDVIAKFNITEKEFNKYDVIHKIFEEKISSHASIRFYITASAYEDIPDGWYTKKVFNANANVEKYWYVIDLSGNGMFKEKDVLHAIENSLSSYELIPESDSEGEESVEDYRKKFRNDYQLLDLYFQTTNTIVLSIEPNDDI